MVKIIAFQKGQKAMNKFREFYPFDFRLLNKNDEHEFYIQDSNESIRLSILNKTDKSIEFKNIPEKDFGINNFHFMLRFRPGVIAKPDKISLKDGGAWSLTTENQNGLQLLCFRKKTQEENDLSEVKNPDIQINNLMADPVSVHVIAMWNFFATISSLVTPWKYSDPTGRSNGPLSATGGIPGFLFMWDLSAPIPSSITVNPTP